MSMVVVTLDWVLYGMILRAIDHHAWRWIRTGAASPSVGTPEEAAQPDDLAGRLRRLAGFLVPMVGLFALAWVWNVDWALFRFLGKQPLWTVDAAANLSVTVGDVTKALLIFGLTTAAWRHMSTFFAVAVFPRIPDDPGVRFALVTLCRYAVLGLGLMVGLSAIHLGLEKISVVLAALGVGLGFGLQEIVSNFVCGIILLLERPIRVGDIVTVSGMSGKVDRINIRATTILNGDNQSIIVPNRAFITTDLINWTLKDKVIRVSVRVKVAQGSDPDRVTDLLLTLAREDADVLRNPLPAAMLEDFSDSALNFALHVHVPEPSLGGRVRHRLLTQIQKRFLEAGIQIPVPTQELRVKPWADRVAGVPADFHRIDSASVTPPSPRFSTPTIPTPPAVEDCHRGVDE
jgi:potassium efflux system protein